MASPIGGKLIRARFANGTATTGSLSPRPSISNPSGKVSDIPAAHFASELEVIGATMMPSASRRADHTYFPPIGLSQVHQRAVSAGHRRSHSDAPNQDANPSKLS